MPKAHDRSNSRATANVPAWIVFSRKNDDPYRNRKSRGKAHSTRANGSTSTDARRHTVRNNRRQQTHTTVARRRTALNNRTQRPHARVRGTHGAMLDRPQLSLRHAATCLTAGRAKRNTQQRQNE
jgi:hypothetical protein